MNTTKRHVHPSEADILEVMEKVHCVELPMRHAAIQIRSSLPQ